MQKKHFKKLVIALVLGIVFASFSADAQIRDTDIVLGISPENPSPNQTVNATLGSHSINLDKTNISWLVNNEKLGGGIGKKSFSFKMGELGYLTVLSATIDTVDGQSIFKTITLRSTNVDLLWEAYDAYTPPFYRGKALAPSQGKFKVVAIPSLVSQGEKVNINNLSYAWTKDRNPQVSSSGWGKSSFVFQNSYLDKGNVVEVKVSDILGNTGASGKINTTTSNPKILFYEYDSKLGTRWERTLVDGFTINKDGGIIDVEPYFFSPKDIGSSNLAFDWYINGAKIQTPETKNVLPVRPETSEPGNATIRVVIENIKTLFQSTSKQIRVNF